MIRLECDHCSGKGYVMTTIFNEHVNVVKKYCDKCQGSGELKPEVDPDYDGE